MLLLLFTLLAACRVPGQAGGESLAFETIEQRTSTGTGNLWEVKEPGLVIVAVTEEVPQVADYVTEEAVRRVEQVEFSTHFVTAVFLGWQPNIHEGITIEQVTRLGDTVTIDVQVGELGGQEEESSPYHIVQVGKEGEWAGEVTFVLRLDGRQVLTTTHFIP